MGGRRAWEFGYSPHLPPLEAWKEPERWINTNTGLPLPDRERMELPVDDRGIILADKAVQLVKSTLFRDDYNWAVAGERLHADIHHFYYPAEEYEPMHHDNDDLPRMFRQTATLMGKMPRTFHDALHEFTYPLEMPSHEVMSEYRQSYLLAYQAFNNLIRLAQSTSNASHDFYRRRQSLATGKVAPKDPEDQIGQEILRDSFATHFSRYTESVELARAFQGYVPVDLDLSERAYPKPHLVARKIGKRGLGTYVNYLPEFTLVA